MKNILVYLYYPFVSQHLSGGVQIIMRKVLEELSGHGFCFRVLCPKIKNSADVLNIRGVEVFPVLNDFQNNRNYAELSENFSIINKHIGWADVVWTIDRNVPIKTDKPIILSLNAHWYATNQNALFSMNWDKVIALSDYSKDILEKTIKPACWHGSSVPTIERISPVLSEILYKRQDCSCLSKYFDYNPEKKYILFPHRPDKGKGHKRAIDVLKSLCAKDPNYVLLIPGIATLSEKLKSIEATIIEDALTYAQDIGVRDNVILHDWIQYDDLPYFYSAGTATLIASDLEETFGMTLTDSILCGCPVISTGSGALRFTVPDGLGHKIVDYNKPDDVANTIISGIPGIADGIIYIKSTYNTDKIISQYKNLFETAQKTDGVYYE